MANHELLDISCSVILAALEETIYAWLELEDDGQYSNAT